jgi:acetate---CoA ligase (ADP-forming)
VAEFRNVETARTAPGARDALSAMLEARSVAIVGASPREHSFGHQMMDQLAVGGYAGSIYPVNPNHGEIMGLRCYPSLEAVPEPVDLAVIGVRNAQLEGTLRAAVESGARSAVIFASCWEAPHPQRPSLHDRLAAMAREAGMAVCGGNCMGFINFEHSLRACGFAEPPGLQDGPITFISHSGSAFSAMLHNDRGLRFNLAVSSGTEMVTTAADYLHYALDRQSTKAIGLYMETARDPGRFRAALERASRGDIPVVALKVGREASAKELVAAHSGALAGDDGGYQALFETCGVLRVETLDEMADTLELMVSGRRAGPGGLAAIHDSGGERVQLIDAAAEAGVRFAQITEATRERLASVLEEGLPPVNPLDAWGTGNDADGIFIRCMHALLDDPDTAALAFCVDMTTEVDQETGYSRVANEVFAGTGKPVAVLSNMAGAIDRHDAEVIRGAGVPILEGTATGLAAFRHLFEYRDHRALPPLVHRAPAPEEIRKLWVRRLGRPQPLTEIEGLTMLADYGIVVADAEGARSEEEALAAADRIGWPVALKTAAASVIHKTDVDGVRLGLAEPGAVIEAYGEVAGRLGRDVVVEAMAPPGVELAMGVVRDPQFGPLVMVAAGGVLVEVLRDRRFGLPPLDEARAHAMVDQLTMRPMLDGVRGSAPADVPSVVDAMIRLSGLALDLGEHIDALDVNPMIAGPGGCVAVDVLVIPRKGTSSWGDN